MPFRWLCFLGCVDVVAGCGEGVLSARWPSGAGAVGFQCFGRAAGLWAPEVAADAGGSEPVRRAGFFPGTASVACEGAGETELGVGGDDQPGPAVGGLGGADLRGGPGEGLLEQAEGVFDVEASQVGLPETIVTVSVSGMPQVSGWPKTNSPPCPGGRPIVCGRRGGTARRRTRSERIRARTWTGRSPRRNARRGASYPASAMMRIADATEQGIHRINQSQQLPWSFLAHTGLTIHPPTPQN